MFEEERKDRMNYLVGGIPALVNILNQEMGSHRSIKASAVGMILRGERKDKHGVIMLFKELTDTEKNRRAELAKKISMSIECV